VLLCRADDFSYETAIAQPELKFLILMPALTVFFQIVRRFGPEEGAIKNFESDPIVNYLGGPAKVRALRSRWTEAWTVRK
jgi:hypothetical protein